MSIPAGASPEGSTFVEAENVLAPQTEPEKPGESRYDWGPDVMKDGDLYRMWWVRLGGENRERFPYVADLPDGSTFEFTYPDRGDRVYYAESRDGITWHLGGEDYTGPKADFGPDSSGPLRVLRPAEAPGERMHLGTPSVIKVDGTFYMYYEAAGEFAVKRNEQGDPAVLGEYHNQVFVASSPDGRNWTKHPSNENPVPIVKTPDTNKSPRRQRYGRGQPSVFYRDGTFVLHYVDSESCPGDYIVRIEADNPYFQDTRRFEKTLRPSDPGTRVPLGAVARFAQTDVKYLGDAIYLLRPAYGTGNLGILAGRDGLFPADADVWHPKDVLPQIRIQDPRGENYKERLFPRFLKNPHGEILVEEGRIVFFYGSGLGWKDLCHTWDIHRCEVPLEAIEKALKGVVRAE
jgi:hypothetical protein